MGLETDVGFIGSKENYNKVYQMDMRAHREVTLPTRTNRQENIWNGLLMGREGGKLRASADPLYRINNVHMNGQLHTKPLFLNPPTLYHPSNML